MWKMCKFETVEPGACQTGAREVVRQSGDGFDARAAFDGVDVSSLNNAPH